MDMDSSLSILPCQAWPPSGLLCPDVLVSSPMSSRGSSKASLCHICLDPVEEGSHAAALLGCEDSDQYHAACIQSWLDVNATCPTCRKGAVAYPFLPRMGSAPYDLATQQLGLAAIRKTASVERPSYDGDEDPNEHVNRLGLLGACRLVASAMRNFPTERKVQCLGCEAIEALTARSEQNRAHFESEAAHILLGQALDRFSGDRELQTVACHAIVALASGHAEWQSRFGEVGTCRQLAAMLRSWPDDYGAQTSCIFAVNGLIHRHPPNAKRLADAGVVEPLLLALHRFWDRLDLTDAAITALYTLLFHSSGEDSGAMTIRPPWGSEACRVVVGLMAAHTATPEAQELQEKACFTLARLAFQSPGNRDELVSLNAIQVIARVMEQYAADLSLQIAATSAIVSLYMPLTTASSPLATFSALSFSSHDNVSSSNVGSSSSAATDKKLESAGLKASSHPPTITAVAEGQGLPSFSPAPSPSGGWQNRFQPPRLLVDAHMQNPTTLMAVANHRGQYERIAFLCTIRALATYAAEPDLELRASPALLFLLDAMSGTGQTVLDDEPSAHMFMSAMRNYLYDEDSQDIYLEVIILLTDEHPRTRDTLMKAGLLNHVLELMARSGNLTLQEKCCMCLAVLTEDSVNGKDLEANCGSSTSSTSTRSSLSNNSSPSNFPYHCPVDCLWSEHKLKDILARLVGAMGRHPASAVLQHFAVSCLQNLAEEGGQDVRAFLVETPSVLAMVCRSLGHHPRNEDIQTGSLGLLAALVEGAKDSGLEGQGGSCSSSSSGGEDGGDQLGDKGEGEVGATPTPTSSPAECVEAAVALIKSSCMEDEDDPVLRAGALRWLALLAEDCDEEEARALCSSSAGGVLKALWDDSYQRFGAQDEGVRLACLTLLSHLHYAGMYWPDWEMACAAAVASLEHCRFMVAPEVEEEASAVIRATANLVSTHIAGFESTNATRLAQMAGVVASLLERCDNSLQWRHEDPSYGQQ